MSDPDRDLRVELRTFAGEHPRWGYRRAHAVLVREGHVCNRKKIQRLWREEGLRVPVETPQAATARRLDDPGRPAQAERPDHVWALDYQFDVTSTGRTIKVLHVVDEYTRESLADVVAYNIDADATVNALDRIVGATPHHAGVHSLRQRTRAHRQRPARLVPVLPRRRQLHRTRIPWQNPWVESYGSRMRDELLAIEQFDSLLEAQVLIADWRNEYNNYRPHSALGMLTPAAFAARWRTEHQPQLT